MGAIAVIVVYVMVMLGVGYWAMKRTKSVGDFFLGGRTIGPWMSAFAYGTTYFSAVLFIGYAGKLGWGFGIHTMWIVVGNALIGTALAWKVLGSRTRTMTARLNALTMPDFLAARFNSTPLKTVSALIIFIFLVPYSASVYTGLSYLFEKTMHIPYEYALGFLAALTGVYIMMGGYFALTITDLIRGIVEFVGVAIMVTFLASKVGGFGHATSELLRPENAPALLPNPGFPPGWLTLLSLVIVTSLGPWGLPQMVQKFYSIRSEAYIKSTVIVCTIFALVMAFGAYYTGALTHLYAADDAAIGGVLKELPTNPKAIDRLIPTFLISQTPPAIFLVILLLVFSASMSSLSSLVLVSSSAIAMDLYAGVINPNAPKRNVMILMRVLCGVFVAASLAIALRPSFIITMMVISWGALAGSFAAPYVYGLFWRRANTAGAWAGMLTGLLLALAISFSFGQGGSLITLRDKLVPIAGAVAILVPFLVVPVVTLLTKPMPKDVISRAFLDEQPSES